MNCDFEKLKHVIAAIDENILVYVDGYLCNVHEDGDFIAFINVADDDPNMDIPDSALYITPESDCEIKLHWLNGQVVSVDVDEHDGCVPTHITFAKVIRDQGLTVSELEPDLTFRCPSCGHDKFIGVWEQELTWDESAKLQADGRLVINSAGDAKPGPGHFVEYRCANSLCDAAWSDSTEMAQCGCFPERTIRK